MPRKFVKYLQPYNLFVCNRCGTHIASLGDLVSKTVHPIENTTYFFNKIVNVKESKMETRKLLSGQSQIVDLYCNVCEGGKEKEAMGWKYIKVADPKMQFKEGLSILQKRFLKKQQWIKGQ